MNLASSHWYITNIHALRDVYGLVRADSNFNWILIKYFKIPPVYNRNSSFLVIKTPGNNISNHEGYSFYIDYNLKRIDGKSTSHIFKDHSYNDLKDLQMSRVSFHLDFFRPSYELGSGTLLDICKSLYYFLGDARGC